MQNSGAYGSVYSNQELATLLSVGQPKIAALVGVGCASRPSGGAFVPKVSRWSARKIMLGLVCPVK